MPPVLLALVKQGRVPAVEQLLDSEADPNTVDPATGETPLFSALAQRDTQPQLLALLMESELAERAAGLGSSSASLGLACATAAAVCSVLDASARRLHWTEDPHRCLTLLAAPPQTAPTRTCVTQTAPPRFCWPSAAVTMGQSPSCSGWRGRGAQLPGARSGSLDIPMARTPP